MKVSWTFLALSLVLFLLIPCSSYGQVDPKLTVYDLKGGTYWNPDNSTVFSASPGTIFNMEVSGAPMAPFGLYLSLYTTMFPLNITPPPLFIMPPILPIIAGPDTILDTAGKASFNGFVPTEFSALGYDLNIYFQAFVQDPVNGFQLTNGIRMEVLKSQYKADLAVAEGTSLDKMTAFGRIEDKNAGDNLTNGPNLQNGADLVPDLDIIQNNDYDFSRVDPMTGASLAPLYLNGVRDLVPGDAGVDRRFNLYPNLGSSPYIHTRDRVCRNNENKQFPHIIVPIFDQTTGEKTHDLNVYHFYDSTTGEYGYMAVDTLTNDMYELTGTRRTSTGEGSKWHPHVAVSPDGLFMAAVEMDLSGDISNKDKLFIIKLRPTDLWKNNEHAQKVTLDTSTTPAFAISRIFAETMTFAGAPEPHYLFFVGNKLTAGGPPYKIEPTTPSVLWKVKAAKADFGGAATKVAKFHSFTALGVLTGGNKYEVTHYGSPKNFLSPFDGYNNLNWLRSEDNTTILFRAAGRYAEPDGGGFDFGDYCWDIIAINNISFEVANWEAPDTHTIVNVTKFPESGPPKAGFHIAPFGNAYNGYATASISPSGKFCAFTARAYGAKHVDSEDLYMAKVDGTTAGTLSSMTTIPTFTQQFDPPNSSSQAGRKIYDPMFVNDDDLLFFCGTGYLASTLFNSAQTDLYVFKRVVGDYVNLTATSKEITPPFAYKGNVRPAGIIRSLDGQYVFFFRGKRGTTFFNLVGIDLNNDYELFDLTGGEFSNGFIPDLAVDTRAIGLLQIPIGPEYMNVSMKKLSSSDVMLFSAKQNAINSKSYQVYMLNMNFPLAAFPVTSFIKTLHGFIDNLVMDSTGNYIAFSRSKFPGSAAVFDETDGASEKLWVVDLSQGAYMRDLTESYNWNAASIDGSIKFLDPSDASTPYELIFGMGAGGAASEANNPSKARVWLYPLESVANPVVPLKVYPLTKEGQWGLLNVKSF